MEKLTRSTHTKILPTAVVVVIVIVIFIVVVSYTACSSREWMYHQARSH
jgi:hypothetical protein